jgi:hypothetical protein
MTASSHRAVARRRLIPRPSTATLMMGLLAFNLVADILWRAVAARFAGAAVD